MTYVYIWQHAYRLATLDDLLIELPYHGLRHKAFGLLRETWFSFLFVMFGRQSCRIIQVNVSAGIIGGIGRGSLESCLVVRS